MECFRPQPDMGTSSNWEQEQTEEQSGRQCQRDQPGMSTSGGGEQDLDLRGLRDDQGAEGEGMGGYGREQGGGDAGRHHRPSS